MALGWPLPVIMEKSKSGTQTTSGRLSVFAKRSQATFIAWLFHRTASCWPVARAIGLSPCGRYRAAAGFAPTNHPAPVLSVAFSPDGRTLATASNPGTVKLFDLSTAQELCTVDALFDGARAVAFHPDGNQLFTLGDTPGGKTLLGFRSAPALSTLPASDEDVAKSCALSWGTLSQLPQGPLFE